MTSQNTSYHGLITFLYFIFISIFVFIEASNSLSFAETHFAFLVLFHALEGGGSLLEELQESLGAIESADQHLEELVLLSCLRLLCILRVVFVSLDALLQLSERLLDQVELRLHLGQVLHLKLLLN